MNYRSSKTGLCFYLFSAACVFAASFASAHDAQASRPQQEWLEEAAPMQSLALDWQEALELERIVIPPAACLDLFEREDAHFDDMIASEDYQETFSTLQRSDLPALIRLMGRMGCVAQLRVTPRESSLCRALRIDARRELSLFTSAPSTSRFLCSRMARAYLALVDQARALGCYAQHVDRP